MTQLPSYCQHDPSHPSCFVTTTTTTTKQNITHNIMNDYTLFYILIIVLLIILYNIYIEKIQFIIKFKTLFQRYGKNDEKDLNQLIKIKKQYEYKGILYLPYYYHFINNLSQFYNHIKQHLNNNIENEQEQQWLDQSFQYKYIYQQYQIKYHINWLVLMNQLNKKIDYITLIILLKQLLQHLHLEQLEIKN